MMIPPSVPISTQAPLSHRLVVRHIGSSADITPTTTTPNHYQKQDAPSDSNTNIPALSIRHRQYLAIHRG
jgi:hypothetical protein